MNDIKNSHKSNRQICLNFSFLKDGSIVHFRTPTLSLSEQGALLRFPIPDPFIGVPVNVDLIFITDGWEKPVTCRGAILSSKGNKHVSFDNFDENDLVALRAYIDDFERIGA